MNPDNVTLPLAVFGGLLSFASPCVLPLVPAYLGYLSGRAVTTSGGAFRRLDTFWHALAFVLGFSVIFVSLGASIGLLGKLLYDSLPLLQKIGGIIIVLFGLHTIGLFKIPLLYQERRVEIRKKDALGYVSSFLMGVFFSAGWVPCVGPILAAILLLASNVQTATQGAMLLGAYSLGLGIPFLAVGLAFNALSGPLRRLNRHLGVVSVVSGAFLVAIGALVFTDSLRYFARFGSFLGGV
jgi:cytochrome c-type biogenesis protein